MVVIQPKEFANPMKLMFENKPDQRHILKEIERISKVTRSDSLKKLCDRCKTGITCYGVPVISENNEGFTQWKVGGESEFSSKGFTGLKLFNIVEN
jgi:hypothetical protein